MHSFGIIHRDMKLENVILGPQKGRRQAAKTKSTPESGRRREIAYSRTLRSGSSSAPMPTREWRRKACRSPQRSTTTLGKKQFQTAFWDLCSSAEVKITDFGLSKNMQLGRVARRQLGLRRRASLGPRHSAPLLRRATAVGSPDMVAPEARAKQKTSVLFSFGVLLGSPCEGTVWHVRPGPLGVQSLASTHIYCV